MHTLYDQASSGNAYKVRLLLHQLAIPFRTVEMDTIGGGTRTPEYLAKNPVGKIPLLEFPDGRRLPESNAILWHLGEGTAYVPEDAFVRAQMLSWMFWEQYSHEPFIAVLRSWRRYLDITPEMEARIPGLEEKGHEALRLMEMQLSHTDWLAGDSYSLADVSLYAYTHVADEGGFDMSGYPSIAAWCDRVQAQPGHVPITWQPEGD